MLALEPGPGNRRSMGVSHPDPNIDRIARALAASAGVNWERLDHYPGYLRGIWRTQAAHLIVNLEREARRAA